MSARHCLVTGANRGLGLAFCRQLLARGDRVIAACRHPGRAHELNQLAGEYPARLHVLPLDLTEPKSHAELARELPLVLDEAALDLLINNAGVLHSGERFGHVDVATLDHSLRTNAIGPFLLSQTLAPRLADGATIANLSSGYGSIGTLDGFHTPSYCISKAALNMATALLARALGERGIVVIALSPGWVQTDMGGDQAELMPMQAVRGLLQVIDGADASRSGGFFDWQGQVVPW